MLENGNNHVIDSTEEMTLKSFFFGRVEMSALRKLVLGNIKTFTTFEMLTACLWRCRTITLQPNPEEDIHLIFFANAPVKFNPPIPAGYYENCIVLPCVTSRVEIYAINH